MHRPCYKRPSTIPKARTPRLGERKGQSTITQGFLNGASWQEHCWDRCSLLGQHYPSVRGERVGSPQRCRSNCTGLHGSRAAPERSSIGNWWLVWQAKECGSLARILGKTDRCHIKAPLLPFLAGSSIPSPEFSEGEPSHMLPGAQTGLEHHDTQSFWFVHQS